MLLCSTCASNTPQQRPSAVQLVLHAGMTSCEPNPSFNVWALAHLPEKYGAAFPRCVPAAAGSNLSSAQTLPWIVSRVSLPIASWKLASLSPRQLIQPQLRFRYQQPARHTAYDTRTFTSTTLLHHCMRTPPRAQRLCPSKIASGHWNAWLVIVLYQPTGSIRVFILLEFPISCEPQDK